MIFYGTSAAEGIPNPFCSCDVCMNARQKQGKEIRRRSTFRVDDKLTIDLGADAFQQAIEYGDFTALQHVLVTHTHEDHFNYMMMNIRNMARERHGEPLHYYFTDKAYEIVDFYRESRPIMKGMTKQFEEQHIIQFHKLEFNETVTINEMLVTPFRGNHRGNMGEDCANYLVQYPNGKKIYYGVDTGWYLPETFDGLANQQLDILVSECTFGLHPGHNLRPNSHLNAHACIELFQQLLEQGTIHSKTKIYITHINHFTSTHETLVDWFAKQNFPCEIIVAYDGLPIDFD